MPLPGAGAVAPKGDSNAWDRPRPWPVPNALSLRCTICALSNVAMGLSGKMGGRGNSCARHKNEEELAFCRCEEREKARKSTRCRSISGTSWHLFQVGHSK